MSYERYRDWLDEAEDDISSAEIMLKEGKYSKACFFSQQAAERALKALNIAKYKRYEGDTEHLRIAKKSASK